MRIAVPSLVTECPLLTCITADQFTVVAGTSSECIQSDILSSSTSTLPTYQTTPSLATMELPPITSSANGTPLRPCSTQQAAPTSCAQPQIQSSLPGSSSSHSISTGAIVGIAIAGIVFGAGIAMFANSRIRGCLHLRLLQGNRGSDQAILSKGASDLLLIVPF